jgi:hypothetical protein
VITPDRRTLHLVARLTQRQRDVVAVDALIAELALVARDAP